MKAGLYARAGIAEYWVVDATLARVFVHRSPDSGSYRTVAVHSSSEPITPLADPRLVLRLIDLFPSGE